MSPQLLSINVGLAQPLQVGSETVLSGIRKAPVAGRVRFGRQGLAGDEQADRRYHGGPDKAANVYPGEHFAYWQQFLQGPLGPGAFGENLTTAGLTEDQVAIGDVFRIGTALVQVTQPRQPCGKLAARHAEPRLVRMVYDSRKTGYYLRCLEPGDVGAGDPLVLVERSDELVSVAEAVAIMERRSDAAGAARLLRVEALSEAWREELCQRSAAGET